MRGVVAMGLEGIMGLEDIMGSEAIMGSHTAMSSSGSCRSGSPPFGHRTGPLMMICRMGTRRSWSPQRHHRRPIGTIAMTHKATTPTSRSALVDGGRSPRRRHRRESSRSGKRTRLRRASAILVLLWATGCVATRWTKPGGTDAEWERDGDVCAAAAMRAQGLAIAMPAVPPLATSPSKLDAYRMSTFFTQRQRQQARFASCLREKGYQ
jgi:hypothetical protein